MKNSRKKILLNFARTSILVATLALPIVTSSISTEAMVGGNGRRIYNNTQRSTSSASSGLSMAAKSVFDKIKSKNIDGNGPLKPAAYQYYKAWANIDIATGGVSPVQATTSSLASGGVTGTPSNPSTPIPAFVVKDALTKKTVIYSNPVPQAEKTVTGNPTANYSVPTTRKANKIVITNTNTTTTTTTFGTSTSNSTGSTSVTSTGSTPVVGSSGTSVTGTGSTPVVGSSGTSVTGTGSTPVVGSSGTSVTGTGSTPVVGSSGTSVTGTGSTPVAGSSSAPNTNPGNATDFINGDHSSGVKTEKGFVRRLAREFETPKGTTKKKTVISDITAGNTNKLKEDLKFIETLNRLPVVSGNTEDIGTKPFNVHRKTQKFENQSSSSQRGLGQPVSRPIRKISDGIRDKIDILNQNEMERVLEKQRIFLGRENDANSIVNHGNTPNTTSNIERNNNQ